MRLPYPRSLLAVATLVVAALACCAVGRWAPHRAESQENLTILGSATRTIYAPEALVEFARRFNLQEIKSQEHLADLLREERLNDVWYAMTMRDYFSNGEFRDETIVDYPARQASSYARAVTAIYTLAGGREPWGAFDPTEVRVIVIPRELMNDLPSRTLADLMESVGESRDWPTGFSSQPLSASSAHSQ